MEKLELKNVVPYFPYKVKVFFDEWIAEVVGLELDRVSVNSEGYGYGVCFLGNASYV